MSTKSVPTTSLSIPHREIKQVNFDAFDVATVKAVLALLDAARDAAEFMREAIAHEEEAAEAKEEAEAKAKEAEVAAADAAAAELDPRAVLLVGSMPNTPMGGRLQLLLCFQALGLSEGMRLTRSLSRTEAAKRVNAFLGCKALTRNSKPPEVPRGAGALVVYVSWAIAEAERRNPGQEFFVEAATD